jgi:hypothetical protein
MLNRTMSSLGDDNLKPTDEHQHTAILTVYSLKVRFPKTDDKPLLSITAKEKIIAGKEFRI